jgi:hypothetical protein
MSRICQFRLCLDRSNSTFSFVNTRSGPPVKQNPGPRLNIDWCHLGHGDMCAGSISSSAESRRSGASWRSNSGGLADYGVYRDGGHARACASTRSGAACAAPWPRFGEYVAGDGEQLADLFEGAVGLQADRGMSAGRSVYSVTRANPGKFREPSRWEIY